MDWWLIMRILDILGCAACGLILTSSRYHQWDEWTIKTQDHWWALSAWTFFGAYGTVENIIQDNPGGSRLIVLTLVIALTLRALLRPGELRAKAVFPRKDDT